MKYAYTLLYVKDVSETLAFYEKAFGFKRMFVSPEMDYAEMHSSEGKITFTSNEIGYPNLKDGFVKGSLKGKSSGIKLAFTTEKIEEDYKKAVEAGAIEVQAISEMPRGHKVGSVRDINGFLIELCTPVKS